MAYAAFFLKDNPHYMGTKFAVNDVIFIHPDFRGLTGSYFIDYIQQQLKDLGAQVLSYHVKEKLNWGSLLLRKGFEHVDSLWLKWIGD